MSIKRPSSHPQAAIIEPPPLTRVLHGPSVNDYNGNSSPDYPGDQKLVGNSEGVALGWYVAPLRGEIQAAQQSTLRRRFRPFRESSSRNLG